MFKARIVFALAAAYLCASFVCNAQSSVNPRNEKGLELLYEEKFEEALTIFDQLVKENPQTWAFRNNRATALFHLERYSESLADYKFLANEDPSNGEYAFQAGNCYEQMDSVSQAISFYTIAIKAPVRSGNVFQLKMFDFASGCNVATTT